MDYAVRNPAYGPNDTIECEIEHPELGWIPCTLVDTEPQYETMYAAAVAMTPTPYTPPSAAQILAATKAEKLTYVDYTVGQLRLGYITEIPGQQMIYQTKEIEAKAFDLDTDDPKDMTKYPYLGAEATALGVSPETVASTYMDLSSQWRAVGASLEALRISTKAALNAAADLAAIDTIMTAFEAAISA